MKKLTLIVLSVALALMQKPKAIKAPLSARNPKPPRTNQAPSVSAQKLLLKMPQPLVLTLRLAA